MTRRGWARIAVAALASGVILALVWFLRDPRGGAREDPAAPPTPAHEHGAGQGSETELRETQWALPTHAFREDALARFQAAFEAYEQARAALARDDLGALATQAKPLEAALASAAGVLGGAPTEIEAAVRDLVARSEQLTRASTIEEARERFGEVSRGIIALAAVDPRLAEGWHVFECPMTESFPKWIQRSDALENPYMGEAMPQCGVQSEWSAAARADAAPPPPDDEISHWTCPMHPSVRKSEAGTCPICGMDLVAITRAEVESGTIVVDEARRQRIGVRTARVTRRELQASVRALGEVHFDETETYEVNPRVGGWVERLFVEAVGERVRKGEPLFAFYSPELYAAQLDHLLAVRNATGTALSHGAAVVEASRRRLRLLGMSDAQIRRLERDGEAQERVTITSPASGFVTEKNVVEGAKVEAGSSIFRIADLDRVWVDAEVYEQDLPRIERGQRVRVTLPHLPGRVFEGAVDHIYPTLESATRTGRIRVVLRNPDLELKPNMYADVAFAVELGERLAVPESAVIYSGPRRLVFVDLGEGRLRPREVELGVHAQGYYEVERGLEPGDVVVTSGNFLIAAESRLRSATEDWGGAHAGH